MCHGQCNSWLQQQEEGDGEIEEQDGRNTRTRTASLLDAFAVRFLTRNKRVDRDLSLIFLSLTFEI